MFGTSYMVEKVACLVEKHFANHKPSNEAAALIFGFRTVLYYNNNGPQQLGKIC